MRPTIADIVRETGLTRGTISRALNTEGKYAIAAETRKRVMETAARLGYRPSLIGKALSARSTGLILLVTPAPFAPYYVEISHHLSVEAAGHGYSFVTGGVLPGDADDIPANDWLYGVDGIVVCDCLHRQQAYVAEALRLRIPAVGVGVRHLLPMDFVKVDLYPAACELMAHIVEGGSRRPAMLCSPGARLDDPRLRAYHEAAAEWGFEERYIRAENQNRPSSHKVAVEAYQEKKFDALICENDLMAIGALRGLADIGVRVPEDVRLAGCDGLEETLYQSVPITTLIQPLPSMCATVWSMLQARIDGTLGPEVSERATAVLEIRASTA